VFFVITLVLALLFLPWPWSLAAIAGAALWELCLAFFGIRWTRRGRPTVGVETLVGTQAVALSPLAPEGQVRIEGEIWKARARNGEPIGAGEPVRVAAVNGLTLEVERTR
jgi:membrane-bound serine protease (ClpP class)